MSRSEYLSFFFLEFRKFLLKILKIGKVIALFFVKTKISQLEP